MREISLLDCSVRDGGYLNDWKFGRNCLVSIFERLVDSKIDIIEVGFIDDRRPFDYDRSIGPDTASLKKIWGCVEKRPNTVVGMIDYGTCSIDNIENVEDSFLDGIRVIFKKQKMKEAMEFCGEIKKKGYLVFAQLVSITSYSRDELLELVSMANMIKPYAVSIVDTYGLLFPDRLQFYFDILDANLDQSIRLGFHAHNNFQMAFSNTMAFLSQKTERGILVDGTLYGMGKCAGNAPIELLAMLLNEKYDKDYRIDPLLEAITDSIMPLMDKNPWGYQKNFFMTAKNECHPNYLNYFTNKGNLSVSDLDILLSQINPEEKRLLYDESLAESIYNSYVEKKYDDAFYLSELRKRLEGREILIIGPGKNVKLQADQVKDYIYTSDPVIISINFLPDDYKVDYVFLSKSNRYEEMTVKLHQLSDIGIIATSNLTYKNVPFEYVFNRETLIEKGGLFTDNSFLMLLKILKRTGIKAVTCAGLDGYSDVEANYVNPSMEYEFIKGVAYMLNSSVQTKLNTEFKDMKIRFITYSHYSDVEDMSNAAY
ncbi:MAG: aldolase catalytic domain-containing protein [Lachnospiraceae bacterium]|nr:aldolase catalytic domain-containing protein [Lachnospiraceae bacterium]